MGERKRLTEWPPRRFRLTSSDRLRNGIFQGRGDRLAHSTEKSSKGREPNLSPWVGLREGSKQKTLKSGGISTHRRWFSRNEPLKRTRVNGGARPTTRKGGGGRGTSHYVSSKKKCEGRPKCQAAPVAAWNAASQAAKLTTVGFLVLGKEGKHSGVPGRLKGVGKGGGECRRQRKEELGFKNEREHWIKGLQQHNTPGDGSPSPTPTMVVP